MKRTGSSGSSLTVVSNTSPLHYLVLLGQGELLLALYGRILIPQAVAEELQRTRTPESIRLWLSQPPTWLEIVPPSGRVSLAPPLLGLGVGEREAIALALARESDLVLMDDREGVEEALHAGLKVTGTLGILDRAADRGLISLPAIIDRLQATNFRAAPKLI